MKMTPKVLIKFASVLFIGCICSCSANNEESSVLTVYVSADEHIAREIFSSFTAKTGIEVAWVGDSELSKNTGLVHRLLREQNRPIADVFWSSEILGTIRLANEGVLTQCSTVTTERWPTDYRDKDFRWFGFSPRARVIAYNPQIILEEDLPQTWWEYSDAVIADPRFGTTSTHVAVMSQFPEQSAALFGSMKKPPMLGGNAATVQAVIDGVALYAMTDSDDVYAAIERGESIEMFMPRHHDEEGGGTLLIPNTIGLIHGCQHPILGEKFIDYMLSEEVARILALSPSHNTPLQPQVASQFPELVIEDPLLVDFYDAQSAYNKQLTIVMDALSQ